MTYVGNFLMSVSCILGLAQRVEHIPFDRAISKIDTSFAQNAYDHQVPLNQIMLARQELRQHLLNNLTRTQEVAVYHLNDLLRTNLSKLLLKTNLSNNVLGSANIDGHNSLSYKYKENGQEIETDKYTLLPNVFYLKSVEQENSWSCGYWSLANALALQQLMAENQPIDHQEIAKRATSIYQTLNIDDGILIEGNEIQKEADSINLLNTHVLEWRGPEYGVLPDYTEKYLAEESNGDLAKLRIDLPQWIALENEPHGRLRRALQIAIANNIREEYFTRLKKHYFEDIDFDQPQLINFICSYGGAHWYLISIVKRANKHPILLILDSYNWPVKIGLADYIQTLHKYFIERPKLRSNSGQNELS